MNNGLKPCPLCGGKAELISVRQGWAVFDATIVCGGCGLTLDWHTHYTMYKPLDNSRKRPIAIQHGPDPFEAWNRRASDE